MYKYPILLLGCLLCALSSTTSDEVPTIAISCGETPLSSLPKYHDSMNTFEFNELLSSLWNDDTKVLMVFEDHLSLEDFAWKDADGHSLFETFENAEELRFFPSVNKPEKAVEMLSKNGFSVKMFNENTYVNGSGKMIALADFNKDNNNDDRQSMLQRHHNDVSKIFNNLCKQYTNVVLIFSGKLNPWEEKAKEKTANRLVTRHLMAVDSKSNKMILDPKGKALIYSASRPTLSVNGGPDTDLTESSIPVFLDDSRDSLLKVGKTFLANNTKVTLRFRFERSTFNWDLKSIEYENGGASVLLTPKNSVGAQMGLSYFTEGPVVFSNDSIVVTFKDTFQAQPWLTSGSSKFSDPQEQDSFFTPPILAGLFVTALMLFIVTWGITMIMDIKTMDRFDDPKGKTISINTAE